MADPNLRCQVANAIVDVLRPIPVVLALVTLPPTAMADIILSTTDELAPRSKHPRGAQGWYAGPGVEADVNEAWQQREETRRHLRAQPHSSNLRKTVKMAGKKLRKVRKAAVLSFFWDFVRKVETRDREGTQAGFYKHLKTMNLKGKRDRSSAYVKDGDGVLLRDVKLIRKQWVRWYTLSSTPSHQSSTRTSPMALTNSPRTCQQEFSPRCRSWQAPPARWRTEKLSDRTESPLTCSRSPSTVIPPCAGDCSISQFVFEGGVRSRSSGNMPSSWYSIKRRIGKSAAITGAYHC